MTKEEVLQRANDYCNERSYDESTLTPEFKDKFADFFAKIVDSFANPRKYHNTNLHHQKAKQKRQTSKYKCQTNQKQSDKRHRKQFHNSDNKQCNGCHCKS